MGEQALAALGIGGAAGEAIKYASNGNRSKSQGDSRDNRDKKGRRRRDSSSDSRDSRYRSRSRGRGDKAPVDPKEKIQQAVKSAVIAGATEAFRMRKEPGGWKGEKGKRVLTAAIGAGGIDGLLDKDGNKGGGGDWKHTAEAVIGGLAGNRLLNGSRDDSEKRSRSRSRGGDRKSGGGGGGLGELAAGGLAAAAAKAFADRGKSNDRGRGRAYDSDSEDSRDAGRRRGKSVSDYVRQGMGAIGIGGDKNKRADNRSRDLSRGGPDDYSPPRPRGGGGEGGVPLQQPRNRALPTSHNYSASSSDEDISSTEDEREKKHMSHRQMITAGLASVATIHAAHSIYQTVEGRKKHLEEFKKGEITGQELRKKKNKALFQDAASVGIAALGIKGAYSEWKEVKEQRHEALEFAEKAEHRHEKRLHRLEGAHEYGTSHGYGPGHSPDPNGLHPGTYQDQYRASAPDLRYGEAHANTSAPPFQHPTQPPPPGGYYTEPPRAGPPQQGASPYPEMNAPHYADDNPFHSNGVPIPPDGQGPYR